jgi:hypothetical protein
MRSRNINATMLHKYTILEREKMTYVIVLLVNLYGKSYQSSEDYCINPLFLGQKCDFDSVGMG